MISDIEKAFTTSGSSVFEFFQRPGMGLYIPLYQREYSWDESNIEQLLEDVAKGIENLCEAEEGELRFLGTVITIVQNDKRKIDPVDLKAIPTSVEYIIDGQQRLTSLSIFALILHKQIRKLKDKLKKVEEDIYVEIEEACDLWLDKLLEVFSLNLGKGKIKRKSQIVRGQQDRWVKDGEVNGNYTSPIANLIANYLEHLYSDDEYVEAKIMRNEAVGRNYYQINKWLENNVLKAHVDNNGEFISALKIVNKLNEEFIWQNERPELKEIVCNYDQTVHDARSKEYLLSSLVQIFSVCHYILDRCCFTHIVPLNEDWAFDMFQSLNASGTPLTAIETFKPLVVNKIECDGVEYKDSTIAHSFEKIEALFSESKTAAQKSKRTNELLTSFRIPIDGKKLLTHFSAQRAWLNHTYESLNNNSDNSDFIHLFGNYAEFYHKYWSVSNLMNIDFLGDDTDQDHVLIPFLFLKECKHNMCITILGRLYHQIRIGKENATKDFVRGIKLLAAFYTVYRSVGSNSGLDNVYRKYFEGYNKEFSSQPIGWLKDRDLCVNGLETYLVNYCQKVLAVNDFDSWFLKANQYLNYTSSKQICKLTLFVAADDTIPNPIVLGLMKKAKKDSNRFMTLRSWTSDKLSTIEHIAPQANENSWSESLYGENALYNTVGNLTLFPIALNASLSNKSWKEKWFYFKYVTTKDKSEHVDIKNSAKGHGVKLNDSTLKILESSEYYSHIESIASLGIDGVWDEEIVRKRSKFILELLWNWINENISLSTESTLEFERLSD